MLSNVVIRSYTFVNSLRQSLSPCLLSAIKAFYLVYKKVKLGYDQEMAQSERNSQAKNRGGKKLN